MTLHLKARDLLLAALLLSVGVVVGLAFNASPSRAQVGQCAVASGGAGSAYVVCGDRVFACTGAECRGASFR